MHSLGCENSAWVVLGVRVEEAEDYNKEQIIQTKIA